jgi:hypothetical protein
LQRIDVKIIDSSFVGVSAFTFHNDVDPYYESLASLKSKDEFAISNRSSEAGGVKVRLGALSLTTTYTNSIMLSAPAPATMSGAGSPTETQQDQMLAIDLTDVRKRSGDAPPSVIWALAPSSIYVKLYGKQTSYATAAEGPPDRTTGVTSGAYWGWNGGNASVSYWRYYLDSQRTGDASYDSAGRGIDANFGAYAGAIGFYAGLSYRRSDDLAPISKAVDQSYDAYASAIYKPEHFPDILVEGSFGNSGYNSLVYGVTSDSAYRSGTLGLDFSKYLWTGAVPNAKVAVKGAAGGVPNLRLFYRYQVETDHGIVGATPGDSHFVGMTFRAGLSGAPDSFVGRSRPFP